MKNDNSLDSVGYQDIGDVLASLGVLSLGEEQHLGVVTQLVLRGAWRRQMWVESGIACCPPDLAAAITTTTENRLRRTVPNQAGTQDKAAALSVSIQSPVNYSTAPQPYNQLTSPAYYKSNTIPLSHISFIITNLLEPITIATFYNPSAITTFHLPITTALSQLHHIITLCNPVTHKLYSSHV